MGNSKHRLGAALFVPILGIIYSTAGIASDAAALARVQVSDIQKLSQHNVREIIRRMTVEEIYQLQASKKSPVLKKLGQIALM